MVQDAVSAAGAAGDDSWAWFCRAFFSKRINRKVA